MKKKPKTGDQDQVSVWLISANDLLSGEVIYLTATGDWSRNLNDALCREDKNVVATEVTELETQQNRVLGPTLVEACINPDGTCVLQHFRDRFRDSGPTHRVDLPRKPYDDSLDLNAR